MRFLRHTCFMTQTDVELGFGFHLSFEILKEKRKCSKVNLKLEVEICGAGTGHF